MGHPQATRRVLVIASGDAELGTAIAGNLAAGGHTPSLATSAAVHPTADDRIRHFTLDDRAQNLEAEVESLFDKAGPIDALIVANSAPGERCPVERLASGSWSDALRRNATLAFLVSRQAVPVLKRAEHPRMVFIVPEQVRGTPDAGSAAYLAAKASVIGLARTLALELGPEGFTVNTVACPFADLSDAAPARRTARPITHDDVAAAVSFLLSHASGFITGKTLDVNGGRSML